MSIRLGLGWLSRSMLCLDSDSSTAICKEHVVLGLAAPQKLLQSNETSKRSTDQSRKIEPSSYGSSKDKGPVDTVIKLLGRYGKKLEDGTRKANETAGNVWQHLRTSPNLYDAAIGRLAQGTKVLAEGGSDKLFQHLFGVLPGEKLHKAFACYISTSNGPIIGTLYVSTKRIAFCSDNSISHYNARGVQEWVYYKDCMISKDGQVPHNSPSWYHAPFDLEGTIGSLMAAETCIIGLQYGHVLVYLE